ncbi:zona pellucida sperm-binding protein 4-like isoform X2 [Archocentrus centrarchus]|uniref:zona pellucida sperm-binding protein 4-like isoform X2 n=1 Tax=Archocentrus centrarchus TaxID=63155 RepID=UPI0011E9F576|nr:zona pellucida sperm-binding protein 4-like isoform X2 [Archocentrus centrarchus]
MELFKCLFSVVVVVALVCCITAQHSWMLPLQKPQSSHPFQWVQEQSNIPPTAAPLDKCMVEEAEKIRCGTPDLSPKQCEKINCCFDGLQCYYGKAVTVQCTRDGQFVVVVARDATLPPTDVNSISLLQTDDVFCNPVDSTSAFAIFQFPVTACGTTVTEDNGYVVYENHMSSSYEVGVGVKGCVEEVAAYSSFYAPSDYPITKVLREPVYVEVRILERSDPNIILNLDHCWATSNPNPDSLPQWDLLINGCPYHDDNYLTTVVHVDGSSGLQYPTHHKRFVVQMFTFVNPNNFFPQKDTVFIHCTTAVCYPTSAGSCEQYCHRQRRAVPAARNLSQRRRALVSSGAVILTEKTTPALKTKLKR